jgi:hypothetical protein
MGTHKRSDVVPHYTTQYVERQNRDGARRDPFRTARAWNMGRHHPRSSWQRQLRPRITVY